MKSVVVAKWVGVLAVLLLCFGGSATAQDASYVGMETCKGCHQKEVTDYGKSFHSQAWVKGGKYETSGCEACHGPGSKHAESNVKEEIVSFGKESTQTAKARAAFCLNCHTASKELDFWAVGKHATKGVACTDCHRAHVGGQPKVDQPNVCFDCHLDIRLEANQQSHHPIVEGKVSCSDCHNPHGSLSHGMLRADSKNQLCYKCHADKRGPFPYEHPPVEEDCGTCHEAHGSLHDKLLTQRLPDLCQDCHRTSAFNHPKRAYDESFGFSGSKHDKMRFTARACVNCHNMIHGSSTKAAFAQ
jgi:DmsE family decaheme c-type cytochrome